MSGTTTGSFRTALELYDAGDFAGCRAVALELLAASPDDPELLRLAGRAGVELGLDDAVAQLERAAARDDANPELLRDLAEAQLIEGRPQAAAATLARAVALAPDDARPLIDLAHALHATGEVAGAAARLERALELDFGNLGALRGLFVMYRELGRPEDALAAGRKLITYRPEDVSVALETAELTLELGRVDEAVEAFRWLRDVDDEPEHEVYSVHGMIEAELRSERLRAALDLAIDATRVDRLGRTTDILAYVVAQVFGASGRRAPARRDVEEALAASRAEHRRLHAPIGF